MQKNPARLALLGALGVLVAIQLIPISRDNPPATGRLTTRPDIEPILHRACYNCHSHETVWPWYSYVAPVSWFVGHDVHEGRAHLNFSAWSSYARDLQQRKLLNLSDEVKMGDMPPWYYGPLHSEAHLSQADVDAVVGWAESSAATLTR